MLSDIRFSLNLFPWPPQLVYSHSMFAGLGGWDNRMSWGKEVWWGKIFVMCWKWSQRGKEDNSRFSATYLGMILGEWI